MTPEQIDALTLGEVRAICERAADTLAKARDVLSLFGTPPRGSIVVRNTHEVTAEPYPCKTCNRTGISQPGEPVLNEECPRCGNPWPATSPHSTGRPVPMTNKGPLILTAEERAHRASLPAFDKNGEPT